MDAKGTKEAKGPAADESPLRGYGRCAIRATTRGCVMIRATTQGRPYGVTGVVRVGWSFDMGELACYTLDWLDRLDGFRCEMKQFRTKK
jgi:hypothetical protein